MQKLLGGGNQVLAVTPSGDNKVNIPDYVKITKIKDLDNAIIFLKKAVAEGSLSQFWKTDNSFYTKEKIEDIGSDGTYPDYIEIFFKTPDGKASYKLAVETYHGSGGEWERII